MVAMTAVYGWVPYCFDISTTFLQGRRITCDVFHRPPPEIGEPGMVMKLNKSVYSLMDAPLQWYEALNEYIVAIGGVRLLKPVRTPVAIFGSLGVCIYGPASRHGLISYSPIHLT